jgi:IS5 family transposase
MKAHIGVDLHSGLVRRLTWTAANEADVNQSAKLLHGDEAQVYAAADDVGTEKRVDLKDPDVTRRIAMKRGELKATDEVPL